jgi:hypothetical protein
MPSWPWSLSLCAIDRAIREGDVDLALDDQPPAEPVHPTQPCGDGGGLGVVGQRLK